MTLDEWVEENACTLKLNLQADFNVFGEELSDYNKQTLLRLTLMHIREWSSYDNGESKERS